MEEKMADEEGKINLDSAVGLVFNDAAKTISELKSRKWQATTLAVAGIIGIDTFSRGEGSGMPHKGVTPFIILILIGYILVMWRCNTNLVKFKERLRKTIKTRFPTTSHSLFTDQVEFRDAIVDEGTINVIEGFLAIGAFVLAMVDVWTKWFRLS
jgi:hypothetical protein